MDPRHTRIGLCTHVLDCTHTYWIVHTRIGLCTHVLECAHTYWIALFTETQKVLLGNTSGGQVTGSADSGGLTHTVRLSLSSLSLSSLSFTCFLT
jgi:hypothetical protein